MLLVVVVLAIYNNEVVELTLVLVGESKIILLLGPAHPIIVTMFVFVCLTILTLNASYSKPYHKCSPIEPPTKRG